MEPDISTDKKENSEEFAVDTRKTYRGILERKEAELAREAKFERRAMALTKHFMKAHEQKESHRLDDMHEASQRSYDRSMARVRQGFDSEAMLREMVREEKNQISQLMAERTRQRELEEQKKQEAKAERQYYMQARIVHGQLQAEERHKIMEQEQKERAESIRERMRQHEERARELLKEKSERQESTGSKFEANLDKVMERKKHNDVSNRREQHEKLKAHTEREKKALEERQRQFEKKQQSIREAEGKRQRNVQDRRNLEMKELSELANRIIDKGLAPGSSTSRSEAFSPREPRLLPHQPLQAKQANPREETAKEDDARARPHSSALPAFHSKELIDSNNQVHKEYMLKCKELDDASHKMNVKKRYKTLAEGAAGREDDYRAARLKSVHQTHMSTKTKEAKKDVPISTRGPQRPAARSTPRAMRCGFCDKEFPADHLVGSALRKTIEKMRRQCPNLPKEQPKKDDASKFSTPRRRNSLPLGDAGEGSGERQSQVAIPKQMNSPKPKQSLYDYEVKLCVNCDIFVRISST